MGIRSGKKTTIAEYSHAVPVPIAISVSILPRRFRKAAQAPV